MIKVARGFFCVVMVLLCLSAASACFAAAGERKYSNPQLKFSMSYPSSYTVKQINSAIVFSSPLQEKGDTFAESVNVVVLGLGNYSGSFQEFYQRSKKSLEDTMVQMNILEEQKDTLASAPAYRLVFTSLQNKTTFKLMQVMVEHKGLVYLLTYTALPQTYEQYLPAVKQMLKSFAFID